MYRRVMEFDSDGTLAVDRVVPPELENALERCRTGGRALFVVTGRRFETVSIGRLSELFAGTVRENGVVPTHAASGEAYLPFGQLDPRLLKQWKKQTSHSSEALRSPPSGRHTIRRFQQSQADGCEIMILIEEIERRL